MTSRIGLYSGTFDPIHKGHIAFAQAALKECHLDSVVFLPEASPREKLHTTNLAERVNSIKKAINDLTDLSITTLHSAQFSVKSTLPELKELFPNATFTMLLGSDVVRTLPHRWQNLDILLTEISFAVGIRSSDDSQEIVALLDSLEAEYNIPIHYTLIHTEHSHVASSHIRNSRV